MHFLDIPFTRLHPADIARLWLPIQIINPFTNNKIKVFGLLDTGADECALPARYAALLGHNLESGNEKEINTGNGITMAYSHTVDIKMYEFAIKNILIDFMPNLHTPLLGIKSFLSNFILTIDFPKKKFSLQTNSEKRT